MQLTASNQYIIKNNNNLIYFFYLDNKKALNYNIYDTDNNFIEKKQLVTSILDFSVTIDTYGKIHAVCINNKGDLIYYINYTGSWNHKIISKFNMKSNIYRNINLKVNEKFTHILYTKTNLLTPMLSYIEHIYWSDSNINKSIVGNYMHGKYPSPLQISVDRFNNLHLVYKAHYKKNYQLYYSRFSLSTKKWSMGELLTNLKEENSHPYIFIDKKNNLHLVWSSIRQGNFILKYKKKNNIISVKSKWSGVQELSNENSNNHSPILLQDNNILKIYCKQNNQIAEIISKNFGDSWNIQNDSLYNIKNPKVINYAYKHDVSKSLFAKHIYGNIEESIEIIGLNLLHNVKEKEDILNEENNTLYQKDISRESILESKHKVTETHNHTKDTPRDTLADSVYPKNIYTSDRNNQSTKTIDELLSNYKQLEKQLIKIEEEKKEISKSVYEYKEKLNLIDKKIIDFKTELSVLKNNINNLTNTSILSKFLNFFKY